MYGNSSHASWLLPSTPLLGAHHSYLLLWACIFLHLSLVKTDPNKRRSAKQKSRGMGGRQPTLFCFLISVTECRQKLDRNNLQGRVSILAHGFGAFSLWSLVLLILSWWGRASWKGDQKHSRHRLFTYLMAERNKEKQEMWNPRGPAVLPLTVLCTLTFPEPPAWL